MLRRRLLLPALLTALAAALAVPASGALPTSHPLSTLMVAAPLDPASLPVTARRLKAAAVSSMIVDLNWASVAPRQEPASWRPESWDDPNYDWSSADAQVRAVVSSGLQPMAKTYISPVWARLSPTYAESGPDPAAFGKFMAAAAERYSGRHAGLPRVRFWQIWNEPNISLYIRPQFDPASGKFTSPDIYRDMVNAASGPIHAVHADNVVIAGETAPFRDTFPEVQALDKDWGPLKFMRRMLCVDDAGRPTCNADAAFDVWSTHPYTSGGPQHQAVLPYDVSLGDLPEMKRTLQAAVRAGHVKSASTVRFWVSEFGWDSNPPDPCAPPMSLLQRWIPEAMYRIWATGSDLVGWTQLMDTALTESYFQAGLYFFASSFAAAKPKTTYIEGLRFPFVALKQGRRVYVWAHTPYGKAARVTIQQSFKGGWAQTTRLRTDRYGIVQAVLKATPVGSFRAVLPTGEKSLPFSMKVPPDRHFNPFGQATTLEPDGTTTC